MATTSRRRRRTIARDRSAKPRMMAGWGDNVYVTIPVTNPRGEAMAPVAGKLSHAGVHVNVTGVLTLNQVREIASHLSPDTPSCVSIFAGPMGDAGRDPEPI